MLKKKDHLHSIMDSSTEQTSMERMVQVTRLDRDMKSLSNPAPPTASALSIQQSVCILLKLV